MKHYANDIDCLVKAQFPLGRFYNNSEAGKGKSCFLKVLSEEGALALFNGLQTTASCPKRIGGVGLIVSWLSLSPTKTLQQRKEGDPDIVVEADVIQYSSRTFLTLTDFD